MCFHYSSSDSRFQCQDKSVKLSLDIKIIRDITYNSFIFSLKGGNRSTTTRHRSWIVCPLCRRDIHHLLPLVPLPKSDTFVNKQQLFPSVEYGQQNIAMLLSKLVSLLKLFIIYIKKWLSCFRRLNYLFIYLPVSLCCLPYIARISVFYLSQVLIFTAIVDNVRGYFNKNFYMISSTVLLFGALCLKGHF